jgi:hypothetical protein
MHYDWRTRRLTVSMCRQDFLQSTVGRCANERSVALTGFGAIRSAVHRGEAFNDLGNFGRSVGMVRSLEFQEDRMRVLTAHECKITAFVGAEHLFGI